MLNSGNLVFWNKMRIEKRKTKILFFIFIKIFYIYLFIFIFFLFIFLFFIILFFNFQIKIEHWKLKKKCLFSIFNFELKLKYAKISFSISILNRKLNGNFGARRPLSVYKTFIRFSTEYFDWKLNFDLILIRAPKVSFNF